METVKQITGGQGKKNVCVMIDYHYCSKDLNDYPTTEQNEIKMIKLILYNSIDSVLQEVFIWNG